MSDDLKNSAPDFVRELSPIGEPVEHPLDLTRQQKEELRLELLEMDRARAIAMVTAQNYILWGDHP